MANRERPMRPEARGRARRTAVFTMRYPGGMALLDVEDWQIARGSVLLASAPEDVLPTVRARSS